MTRPSEIVAASPRTAPPQAFYLARHPSTPCEAVQAIEVRVARTPDGRLGLAYRVEGDLRRVRLPDSAPPRRAGDLWRHTCFEAFVMRDLPPEAPPGGPAAAPPRGPVAEPRSEPAATPPRGPAYIELNFSPSGEWASYAFVGYREGMAPLDAIEAPAITADAVPPSGETAWTLRAAVRLEAFVAAGKPARLALAAVIEEKDGRLSYWALRHPRDKPDFHDPEGFALRI